MNRMYAIKMISDLINSKFPSHPFESDENTDIRQHYHDCLSYLESGKK